MPINNIISSSLSLTAYSIPLLQLPAQIHYSLKLISSQITAASSFLDLATKFLNTEERFLLTQRQSFWSQLQFRRQFSDYMVPHNLPHLFSVKIYEHLLCAHHELSLVPILISYISCRSAAHCPYSLPP